METKVRRVMQDVVVTHEAANEQLAAVGPGGQCWIKQRKAADEWQLQAAKCKVDVAIVRRDGNSGITNSNGQR